MTTPSRRFPGSFVLVTAGCASTVGAPARDAGSPDAPVLDTAIADAPDARACSALSTDVADVDAAGDATPFVVELATYNGGVYCARMSDGTVRCSGANLSGELGVGDAVRHAGVVTVPGLHDVEQVVTNLGQSVCVRRRDATVWCWGNNEHGLLGTGHDGDETCGSGTRCRTRPTQTAGLTDVVNLGGAPIGYCAVRRDGSVWCWGSAEILLGRGSEADVPRRVEGLAGVSRLWSTPWGRVVRYANGTFAWIDVPARDAVPLPIPADARFDDIDPDVVSSVCFRLPDGTARCLGSNANGTLGDGTSQPSGVVVTDPVDPGLCGVRAIASGAYVSCAVLDDGTVWCWGSDFERGVGSPVTESCYGFGTPTPCATRPQRVEGIDGADAVFPGFGGGCVRRIDRTIWCWGRGYGIGTDAPHRVDW